MSGVPNGGTEQRTSLELHLLAALQSIRNIAAVNTEHHTGFVHITRIADAWLKGREES